MKLFSLLLTALVICCINSTALAQNDKPMSPQQKAWESYRTPGPMHDLLKSNEGKWKITTTMWMDPAGQPQTTEGTAESKMMLDGRYLQTTMHSTMMGEPYEGIGYDAYDNALNEFISTWIDNMGTGMMDMHGKLSADKTSIAYSGTVVDPVSKKPVNVWATWAMPDANHRVFTMYSMMKGKKTKTMEMKMDREK